MAYRGTSSLGGTCSSHSVNNGMSSRLGLPRHAAAWGPLNPAPSSCHCCTRSEPPTWAAWLPLHWGHWRPSSNGLLLGDLETNLATLLFSFKPHVRVRLFHRLARDHLATCRPGHFLLQYKPRRSILPDFYPRCCESSTQTCTPTGALREHEGSQNRQSKHRSKLEEVVLRASTYSQSLSSLFHKSTIQQTIESPSRPSKYVEVKPL